MVSEVLSIKSADLRYFERVLLVAKPVQRFYFLAFTSGLAIVYKKNAGVARQLSSGGDCRFTVRSERGREPVDDHHYIAPTRSLKNLISPSAAQRLPSGTVPVRPKTATSAASGNRELYPQHQRSSDGGYDVSGRRTDANANAGMISESNLVRKLQSG